MIRIIILPLSVLLSVILFTVNAKAGTVYTRRDIPWNFAVYAEPDFMAEKMGEFQPQTVNVIEENETGWALIDTSVGEYWGYLNGNRRYIDARTHLFDEKGGESSSQFIDPQVVSVAEQDGDWLLIDTWIGLKWIHLGTVTITLSAAGDCTLGYDYRYNRNFMDTYERQGRDVTYFLRGVKDIFEESDLAIVNLEGPLTNEMAHAQKAFVFRGPPEFARILSSSGVDAVTLANNHTYDYLQAGYSDTVNSLTDEGVAYFGNEYRTIKEVNGIKIGMFGFPIWNSSQNNKNLISESIKELKASGAGLIIAYYHWGIELDNYPNPAQKAIGRFSIDEGCDLVLGSHPHVIQGIEEYRGKNIVYSLGNFCFGGNSNPPDKDAFIFQQTFTFNGGRLLPDNDKNTIPVLISSERNRNNFQPTVAAGADAERIWGRLSQYSEGIK
ncbi:MAG: CapA family protein [Clostridiales bacterium]|nr:CapA family protein [Clostridiales bacterium]